jgi:hypothetical protein
MALFNGSQMFPNVMETGSSLQYSEELTADPWPDPNGFSPFNHPTSLRSILVLYFRLRLRNPDDIFRLIFPIKILHVIFVSPTRATLTTHLIQLDLMTQIISGKRTIKKSLNKQLYPSSYHFLMFTYKYSSQHSVLVPLLPVTYSL